MGVLALDLSTKSTGWATKVNGKLEYGCITASSTEVKNRIITMRDSIVELLNKYDIDTVVYEEVRPDTPNSHTQLVLTWLQGSVVIALYEKNKKLNFNSLQASSWRSTIGIKTGRGIKRESLKPIDIKYVKDKYNIDVNEDIADAIGLLDAFESNQVISFE